MGKLTGVKLHATDKVTLLSVRTRSGGLRTPYGEPPRPQEDSILLRQSYSSYGTKSGTSGTEETDIQARKAGSLKSTNKRLL